MSQVDIFLCNAVRVVRGEVDRHAVIDIQPFGMVISFFDFDGGDGHEAEGVGKIGEAVFAMELFVLDAPRGKFLQSGLKSFRSQFLCGHAVILPEDALSVESSRSGMPRLVASSPKAAV